MSCLLDQIHLNSAGSRCVRAPVPIDSMTIWSAHAAWLTVKCLSGAPLAHHSCSARTARMPGPQPALAPGRRPRTRASPCKETVAGGAHLPPPPGKSSSAFLVGAPVDAAEGSGRRSAPLTAGGSAAPSSRRPGAGADQSLDVKAPRLTRRSGRGRNRSRRHAPTRGCCPSPAATWVHESSAHLKSAARFPTRGCFKAPTRRHGLLGTSGAPR